MKSKTFFYNKGLFKNNLKMYSVISILWGIFLFLTHAFPLMTREDSFRNFKGIIDSYFLPNETYFLTLGMGMIFGFVLFYFLKKDNGIAFHFSLPVTKIQVFNSQFLVALVLGLAPVLLNALLMTSIGLLQIASEYHTAFLAGMGMWTWNLIMTFIIGFFVATAIGVITGSVLWQIVFVGVFYALPYYIYATIDFLGSQLLFGYTGNETLEKILLEGSLLSVLYNRYHSLSYIALYLLIYAVVVGIIAFFLYKYKPMESNREWIAFNFMKVIFVIGFTYCFALLNSMFFFGVLIRGKAGVYLGAALGAVLGYIIAMMIARKTIYLKKAWLGTLVAAVVAIAFVMGVDADVLGFERYIPKAEDVARVEIRLHSNESMADDSLSQLIINDKYEDDYIKELYSFNQIENIKQVMDIHQQIMDSNPNVEGESNMQIRYFLKNGKKFDRYYRNFEVPNMGNNYQAILNSSEALVQRYSILDDAEAQLITGIKVQREQDSIEENFTGENMKELIAVIQEQIKSSAENPEEVEIHSDEKNQVLQLKQPVIRITIRQKENIGVGKDIDDYTREYKEKGENEQKLVFTGKAEILRSWLKAHSSIKVDESINVDEIESISLMEDGYFYGINSDIIYGGNISEDFSNDNTWVVDADRQNFAKYLQKAGLPISGRENIILKIQMENGFAFYRAMTTTDFQQIKDMK